MLFYGSKVCTITAVVQKALEAIEMWCCRRMMKWSERITNESVLRVVEGKRNIMNTLRRSRGRFIELILRHISLLKTVFDGEILRKNYKGRFRMVYIGHIMKDIKTKSYAGMKRLAGNRVEWRAATSQSLD
jgi:hypothetical protein